MVSEGDFPSYDPAIICPVVCIVAFGASESSWSRAPFIK